jgi:putative endonuclease
MNNNKIKGRKGEDIACQFLLDKGFSILETNYYASRHGEIDIIAKDKDTLVFVEVKTRTTNNFGHPLESITPLKIQKMHKAASYYLTNNNTRAKAIRLDAVSITLKPELDIIHIENLSL